MAQVYDLHCHSDQSDGALSPEDLVSRAKERQVTALALTDHDTIAGIERARNCARREGIDLIAGIEFSSQWSGRGIHVVGLNIDTGNMVLLKALEKQARVREERAVNIGERLAKCGIQDAYEGAKAYAGDAAVGRPHFAQYLVDTGAVTSFKQAFKRYLGAGKTGDVKSGWPEVAEVVEWILAADGVAVLAHPAKYNMTRTKLCYLTEAFAEAGGQAIEVVSGKQPVGLAENLAKIALQYQLAASCGSDFHVPGQPWQELGCASRLPADVQPVWELFS
ncbi:PHP domain-containing protein [Teredinibacter haidensis]|uniref:PHP domain-containing protein n=1 Tax=Teredinibacter haidensis TaxID=2731755 RepID=UPI000948B010|nr:PHP domain-containing protein [Teredinibacter haidensis]